MNPRDIDALQNCIILSTCIVLCLRFPYIPFLMGGILTRFKGLSHSFVLYHMTGRGVLTEGTTSVLDRGPLSVQFILSCNCCSQKYNHIGRFVIYTYGCLNIPLVTNVYVTGCKWTAGLELRLRFYNIAIVNFNVFRNVFAFNAHLILFILCRLQRFSLKVAFC